MYYKTNWSTARKLDSDLTNYDLKKLQTFVFKSSNDFLLASSLSRYMFVGVKNLAVFFISKCRESMKETIIIDAPTRTFSQVNRYLLKEFALSIWHDLHSIALFFFQELEVKLYETRNRTQSSNLNYSMFKWQCQECPNGTKLQSVRDDRNCSSGYFPVRISRGCCWICHHAFVKSEEGQHRCSKCPTDSIPNKNQTKC